MDKVLQEWLQRSEQDYQVACDLFAKEPEDYAESIAFHLQQCIEKLLKAVLVKHRQHVPKTHDLETLAEAINVLIPPEIKMNTEGLETLTVLGIASRYPGVPVSADDLQNAFQICREARNRLLPFLNEKK